MTYPLTHATDFLEVEERSFSPTSSTRYPISTFQKSAILTSALECHMTTGILKDFQEYVYSRGCVDRQHMHDECIFSITKRGLPVIEIIVALIAVFGAVLPYLFQKNKELNLKIADQKREAYASFLKNFTAVTVAVMHDEDVSGKEADLERMLARDQLLLYASDDVIKAYDAWVSYSDSEKHDLDKEGELLSLMFLAIRKDLLGKTRVTQQHLANLNPFNRG